mmetsp:Transcript_31608/g.48337  ORF Transcript_31608/g.48337 Transcript_31608/m.48337 type:complete len:81 (-) Transcript_31608:395-637(-)
MSQKWNDQMMRNKKDFDSSVTLLSEQEIKVLKQIKAIELIQEQSKDVLGRYKTNIHDLSNIQTHQALVLDELEIIEKELD